MSAVDQNRFLSLDIGSSTGEPAGFPTTSRGGEAQNATDVRFGIPMDRKIIYQSVALALTAVVIYVTFALMRFNWARSDCRQPQNRTPSTKRGARRGGKKDSGAASDSSASTGRSSCRTKSTSARDAKILSVMCVCASVLTFARVASEQLEILPHRDERVDCRDYQIAMVVTYCFAATMLYSILWYRVRVFLWHPAMRHLGSKVLIPLAYIALVLIAGASVTNATLFLVTTVSYDSIGGCVVSTPGDTLSNSAKFGILTISTVLSQGSLLGLFLYPLVRHSVTMRSRKISNPSASKKSENESAKATRPSIKQKLRPGNLTRNLTRGRNTTKRLKKQQALVKVIRRVMITAIICALSDIFCGFIVRLTVAEPRIITNLIFDVNIVVNLASVLMSFKDWRVRLCPCCVRSRKSESTKEEDNHRREMSHSRTLQLVGQQAHSSPAGFTSRESTTQGLYHTSDSAINSLSPREESSKDLEKGYSCDKSTSEDTGKGASA